MSGPHPNRPTVSIPNLQFMHAFPSPLNQRAIFHVLTAVAIFVGFPSCQALNRAAKPSSADPSAFLQHGKEMKELPERSPFRMNWINPSVAAQNSAAKKNQLYIAPVSLEHLRRISKTASRMESTDASQQKAAKVLATYLHDEFTSAFRKSSGAHYKIVDTPSSDALRLDLALVELNPNSISAGVVRTAASLLTVPGVDSLLGRPLKGNLAIEGRLSDPSRRQTLFEFADREENKSSVLFTFDDFTTYGQARNAIREWAAQFEEMTRTPDTHRVRDSSALAILPW